MFSKQIFNQRLLICKILVLLTTGITVNSNAYAVNNYGVTNYMITYKDLDKIKCRTATKKRGENGEKGLRCLYERLFHAGAWTSCGPTQCTTLGYKTEAEVIKLAYSYVSYKPNPAKPRIIGSCRVHTLTYIGYLDTIPKYEAIETRLPKILKNDDDFIKKNCPAVSNLKSTPITKNRKAKSANSNTKSNNKANTKANTKANGNTKAQNKQQSNFWSGGTASKSNNNNGNTSNDFWSGSGFNKNQQGGENDSQAEAGNKLIGDVTIRTKRLRIVAWDHSEEDGDRVKITNNGKAIYSNITLKHRKKDYWLDLNAGMNRIEIIALNQGTAGPNTAQFEVYDDKNRQIAEKHWNLQTGFKATLLALKL